MTKINLFPIIKTVWTLFGFGYKTEWMFYQYKSIGIVTELKRNYVLYWIDKNEQEKSPINIAIKMKYNACYSATERNIYLL